MAGVKGLKKNSVGTKQLKSGAVTTAKIKANAVDGSKVKDGSLTTSDLDKSVLAPYAKESGLPLENDAIMPYETAGLSGAIYNVGVGGVDCQGTEKEFPDSKPDDIDFATVDFDTGAFAHTEPGAAPNCYNGFEVRLAGTYLITAWVAWDTDANGGREIALSSFLASEGCCKTLAVSEQAANDAGSTSQTVSAIVRPKPGTFLSVVGRQDSGGTLGLAGGGVQIAWLGP